jgi:NAD(P)-dependent dehydrogenase (short-subunit alcohol dehydrogenase family)
VEVKVCNKPASIGHCNVRANQVSGIGFGCTYTLLKHNIAKLFILSPRKAVFDGAKEVYAKELGDEKANRVEWIQCDLADWNDVYEVAEKVKQKTDRLDILINK